MRRRNNGVDVDVAMLAARSRADWTLGMAADAPPAKKMRATDRSGAVASTFGIGGGGGDGGSLTEMASRNKSVNWEHPPA